MSEALKSFAFVSTRFSTCIFLSVRYHATQKNLTKFFSQINHISMDSSAIFSLLPFELELPRLDGCIFVVDT